MIPTIPAIAGKNVQQLLWSYGKPHFSDRCNHNISQWFHIRSQPLLDVFSRDRSDRSNHMETSLNGPTCLSLWIVNPDFHQPFQSWPQHCNRGCITDARPLNIFAAPIRPVNKAIVDIKAKRVWQTLNILNTVFEYLLHICQTYIKYKRKDVNNKYIKRVTRRLKGNQTAYEFQARESLGNCT